MKPGSGPGSGNNTGLPAGSKPFELNESEFDLSDLDKHIVELNHERLSMREISRELKARYNITLGRSSVIRHIRELRQDPDNDIQINYECNVPKKPREEYRWYKIVQRLQTEIPAYTKRMSFKPSSRTMFYHFQDLHLVKPHELKTFVTVTRDARLGWVDADGELYYPKLDIDCFTDDSRKEVGFYDNSHPEEPGKPGPIPDPDRYIDDAIEELKKAVRDYEGVGTSGRWGTKGGRWYGQSEYVEVWEEKNDLLDGFEIILKGKDIKIRANKGYPSLVWLNMCCVELKKVIAAGYEPEEIHILYCGDWDPSGAAIDYYIKKRLKQLGIEGIDFQRVAVTSEQIKKYNLPLMSIEQAPDKKAPNPNMAEFKRLYGDAATHLNAFFTEAHLKDFKKILRAAVDKHWDKSVYQEMVEDFDERPDAPASCSKRELQERHRRMFAEITAAFADGWHLDEDIDYDYFDNEDNEDEE